MFYSETSCLDILETEATIYVCMMQDKCRNEPSQEKRMNLTGIPPLTLTKSKTLDWIHHDAWRKLKVWDREQEKGEGSAPCGIRGSVSLTGGFGRCWPSLWGGQTNKQTKLQNKKLGGWFAILRFCLLLCGAVLFLFLFNQQSNPKLHLILFSPINYFSLLILSMRGPTVHRLTVTSVAGLAVEKSSNGTPNLLCQLLIYSISIARPRKVDTEM